MLSPNSSYKTKIAANLGNFVEWYDFTIFAYFATIIAQNFFPSSHPTLSLMATFASFAAGYLMRPIGAIFCSHIGDKKGKGGVLRILILLISIPTFLTGLLPTYHSIGILAPLLITFFRMLQGFCVGPQFSGSIIYIAEASEKRNRGLHISITWAIATFGCIAGMLACYVTLQLLPQAAWNWRIPFLLSIIPLVLSPFLKRHLVNLPKPKDQITQRFPLLHALKTHGLTIITIPILHMVELVAFYLLYIFNVSFLHTYGGLSLEKSILLTGVMQFLLCVAVIACGYLSDRINNKVMLYTSCIVVLFLAPYTYHVVLQGNFVLSCIMLSLLTICIGFYISPVFKIMPRLFPKPIRYSGFAFSYSISAMLFGGLTPFFASGLIYLTHKPESVAYMLSASALLSLIALFVLRYLPRYAID